MLNCQDARGRDVHLYLSTSKHRTMMQWIHQIDLVINGHTVASDAAHESMASTTDESSSEIPSPGKTTQVSDPATTSVTKVLPVKGPLPLSWLTTRLESFLVSQDASMVLRDLARSQQPNLQFTATHSRTKAQYVQMLSPTAHSLYPELHFA